MAGRWVKAAFLIVLGIVLLFYSGGLVEDLQNMLPEDVPADVDLEFETIWDLMTIVMWILVAWLFVLAALNIAYSFQEAKYSLQEIMKRLDRIDDKLGIQPVGEEEIEKEEVVTDTVSTTPAVEEEIPPPPKD